ncbi:MAG TPA: dephospho-CoA kinase [Vicinamibacterales bacterium]
MIRKIALTGGMATGKSYVTNRLREAGVPVVDADVLAREVVTPGSPGLNAVRKRFGPDAVRRDGTMDRVRIAQIVFKDKRARLDLEAIIHPAVQKAIDDFFASLPKRTPFAVADVPLLFETNREKQFQSVIVVACPRAMQIDRIMERNKLSKEDAERRLAAQWPIEKKVEKATWVIKTDGSFDDTNAQVDKLIATLTDPKGK